MRLSFVVVATILGVTACGEDPILKRAREDAAAKAAVDPGASGAPAPGGEGGGVPPAPGADGVVPAPPGGGQGPPIGYEGPGVPKAPEVAQAPGIPEQPEPAPPGSPGGAPHDGEAPGAGGVAGGAVMPPPDAGPTVVVGGVVEYSGWKRGVVRVDAFDGDHTVHGAHPGVVASARLPKPGPFSLLIPQNSGRIYVEAVVDEDEDGRPGPQDPRGTADRYPVTVGDEEVSGLTVKLVKHEAPGGGGKGDF